MKTKGSGSDYFASMTDMMIGILFIFVVMIAFFAFQINTTDSVPRAIHDPVLEENKRLKDLISELQKSRAVPRDTYEKVVEENNRLKELISELQKAKAVPRDTYDTVVEDNKRLRERISVLQKPNPLELYLNKGREVRDQIVSSTIKKLQSEGIDARSVRQGVITISGKGLFGSGRSDLDSVAGAQSKVSAIARTLESQILCFVVSEVPNKVEHKSCNPENIFVEAVFIEGHTDNIPVTATLPDGSTSNLELSARRATNTYQQIVKEQPMLKEFKNPFGQQALSVAAYGEQRPIANNLTPQGRDDNRRIDIRLVMHAPVSKEALDEINASFGGHK